MVLFKTYKKGPFGAFFFHLFLCYNYYLIGLTGAAPGSFNFSGKLPGPTIVAVLSYFKRKNYGINIYKNN
jgi:hypothetical protein